VSEVFFAKNFIFSDTSRKANKKVRIFPPEQLRFYWFLPLSIWIQVDSNYTR
jgi:hypothetical protein